MRSAVATWKKKRVLPTFGCWPLSSLHGAAMLAIAAPSYAGMRQAVEDRKVDGTKEEVVLGQP
jgi:hypothetical protein